MITFHTLIAPESTPGTEVYKLSRRGIQFGWLQHSPSTALPTLEEVASAWQADQPILLPGIIKKALPEFQQELNQSRILMQAILAGESLTECLENAPYAERFEPEFELAASSFEDNDEQGIEKVFFDVWEDDDISVENLWCKASWLSFEEEDCSLRFRFSFGTEGYEDVAADPERQYWSGALTDLIFPESHAVTEHAELGRYLAAALNCDHFSFTERIIYFNAPNGGAQMHHDVERGHEGVVFTQMTGSTFWLALSKPQLMTEIVSFLDHAAPDEWPLLRKHIENQALFAEYLDQPDNADAESLINHSADFLQQLIANHHAFVLQPGDAILLPQRNLDHCVWHSVFCLGEESGEGLSFALMKTAP